jgi:hypothetical protein
VATATTAAASRPATGAPTSAVPPPGAYLPLSSSLSSVSCPSWTLHLTLAQVISLTCSLFCRVEFFTNPCWKASDFFYVSSSPPSISSYGSSSPSPHLLLTPFSLAKVRPAVAAVTSPQQPVLPRFDSDRDSSNMCISPPPSHPRSHVLEH